MRRVLTTATVAVLGAGVLLAIPTTPVFAASCHAGTPSDFNGDGISDAAIAEPKSGGAIGGVHIIYGTRSGLTAGASGTALDDQLIGAPNPYNSFGMAMVAADFNGDGCTDLAVGDPFEYISGQRAAGAVHIYLGGPGGLSPEAPIIDRETFGETPAVNDIFGYSLAAGDVNKDGLPDLIIGAPGEDSLGGAIYIAPGNVDGQLTTAKRFTQGDSVVGGASEADDEWGTAVAAADFDGDHASDVAVGDPGENGHEGTVVVLRGSGTSALLTATGRQTWSQDSSGIPGTSEANDVFGSALAIGDFNGDHHPDLAVGVPGEDVGSVGSAGTVDAIYGSATGLTSHGAQVWTLNSTDVPGTVQIDDAFGRSLAAGDFNGDGRTDLAVGVPLKEVSGESAAGEVVVLPGAGTGTAGLTGAGSKAWSQATPGIAGTAESVDEFGSTLVVLRTRSSTRDDLLVGVPRESLSGKTMAGVAEFIPGSLAGLTATHSQLWDDDVTGVKGASCVDCQFGIGLA